MKLEFDSVEDLQQFLHWAENFRSKPTTVYVSGGGGGSGGSASMGQVRVGAGGASGAANAETPDTPYPTIDADPAGRVDRAAEDDPKAAYSPEPAKRKRRTKAEIEAAAAAEARPEEAAALAAAAAAGGEAPPAGTNPFEQAATVSPAPASEATVAEDADEAVVTPFQHLTLARAFIAKHGMPKYNESFTKAGLDPNVMAYTAYQRALHLEALTALESA